MNYLEACHGMQSGVAMKMACDNAETTPKHLRVGINSAMVDTASIVRLLIKKGIFSQEEFEEQLAEEMNAEVKRYEKWLTERLGKTITLA